MKRLFFSLYFAITIGLLLISWSSEYLWQQLQRNQQAANEGELHKVIQLAALPIAMSNQPLNVAKMHELNQRFEHQFRFQATHLNQLGFALSQLQQLKEGEVLPLYGNNGQLVLYVNNGLPNLVKIQVLEQSAAKTQLENSPDNLEPLSVGIKLFAYFLLAGLIFLWSKPLWSDIKKLNKMAETFGRKTKQLNNPLSPRSVLFDLGNTLSKMSKTIVDLISLQSQMTHAISHDIRTPLARLKFSIAILTSDQQANDLIETTVNEMTSDIAEIEFLVDEILTFGRLDTQESPLTIETVDIDQLVVNLTEKLKRNETKQLFLDIERPLVFQCDGHLLERALQNIIVNAFRYAQTTIKVTVKQDNNLLMVIDDDGPGIPEMHRGSVFSPFTRLESSRGKKGGGFGLGLSIAEKIVQWHGGIITIEDSPLGGAQFRITLPQQ